MEEDFFISPLVIPIKLTKVQEEYILNLEKIFANNLRDDFALLCNLYKLYKTCGNSYNVDNSSISRSTLGLGSSKSRFTDILANKFGLSEKTIYTYLKIANKFITFLAGEKYLIDELKDYSISKLQELLPLSLNTIEQAFKDCSLNYKSTKKQIREFVKSLKESQKDNKVIEEINKNEEESYNSDKNCSVYITLPDDVLEFCRKQCATQKIELSEYLVNLIKEKM